MAEEKQKMLPAEQIRDLFFDPKVKKAIENVIPKHLTAERLLQLAVTLVRRNYKLMQCTKQSLLSAVMGAAELGLSFEPTLGQAHIVPFKNKRGFMEAQLIPGYKGYIALARRSGEIVDVDAVEVYEKDLFEYEEGFKPRLKHIPNNDEDRGKLKGAYCRFYHKDGRITGEYWDIKRIEKAKNRTKSRDEHGNIVGPWITDFEEMGKVAVIRHRRKFEPVSVEFEKAAELEERALIGESQLDLLPGPEPIDVEAEEPEFPVNDFDGLVKAKAKEGKDISLLKNFIQAVAEANKASEDKVKEEAIKDWENFWKMYEQWVSSQQAEKPEDKPRTNRGRPAGSKNKSKESETEQTTGPEIAQGQYLDCPDRNQKVHTDICPTCEHRQGCPAYGA